MTPLQRAATAAQARYYRSVMRQWALLWRATRRPEQLLAALTLRRTAQRFTDQIENRQLELPIEPQRETRSMEVAR